MRVRKIVCFTFLMVVCLNILQISFDPTLDLIENVFLSNGQKINLFTQSDSDGLRLTLDGNGQSLILDSFDFVKDISNQKTIKSISVINSPGSNITVDQIINIPFILKNAPYSTIANNSIGNFTESGYTCGIKLINCPHTEIYNNTITNITSTSNSVSAIYIVDSENTTIRNNTIEEISSTSTFPGDPQEAFGIHINNSNEVNISDIKIRHLESEGNAYGILVESSRTNFINDSHIDVIDSKSSFGILVYNGSNTEVKNNIVTNIDSSTFSSFGISVDESPYSHIDHNTIQSIIGSSSLRVTYGISLKSSPSVVIEWNDISNLTSSFESIGIFTEDSAFLAIQNNTITDISPSFGLYILKCNVTSISDNIISNVLDWIYIDETSHQVQYSKNKVDGQTLMLQSFLRPADLIVNETDKSSSITWTASDPLAYTYTIFKDGVFKETGQWTNGGSIVHNLNYSLSLGDHFYQIVLSESSGNQIIDDVVVSVVEMDLPQLVHSPDDLYLSIGASDQVLSWTLTDKYPLDYYLYLNGSEITPQNNSWTSSEPIICYVNISGVEEYTVKNYTLVASDISGNTIIDTVLVFVFEVEIKTDMPSQMQYEYEITGKILNLNWTVYSKESGTYTIYQENETVRTVIKSDFFIPGEPILHQIDIGELSVGTYQFIIVINQDIEDYVTVIVYANPDIPEAQEKTNRSLPHHSIPPYLAQPAANPWPALITGGFIVLATCSAMYWVVTRHLMVPSAVKEEKKALKKARKVKDIHEEGKRLGAIGRIYFKAGNFKKAISHHKEALAAFKKAGDKKSQIEELESLGNAYSALGVDET